MLLRNLWLWTSILSWPVSSAWEQCSADQGGGLCPSGNTCCSAPNNGAAPQNPFSSVVEDTTSQSFCISGKVDTHNHNYGDCCSDGITGCGYEYACATVTVDGSATQDICQRTDHAHTDNPVQIPRLRLCQLPPSAIRRVFGLSMMKPPNNNHDSAVYAAPYLTNVGLSLEEIIARQQQSSSTNTASIETIIFTIHGSARNADDYLCCTQAAVPQEKRHSTLLIAPWFASEEDAIALDDASSNSDETHHQPHQIPLRWRDMNTTETEWLVHSFRYGGDSLEGNVSSFAVMDALLTVILENRATAFPHLRTIVVAGHSAGGQYTQRWALLSNHALLDARVGDADGTSGMVDDTKSQEQAGSSTRTADLPSLRVVVANPKATTYLDDRRFDTARKEWAIPPATIQGACPSFNQYPWGLGNDTTTTSSSSRKGSLPSPYKDRALSQLDHNVTALMERYAARRVIYLSGHLDILPNGDCSDQLQGPNRRARSRTFWNYMQHMAQNVSHWNHVRLEVAQVHHDHCLMFQSPEGQMAFWGTANGGVSNEEDFFPHQHQQSEQASASKAGRPYLRRFANQSHDNLMGY